MSLKTLQENFQNWILSGDTSIIKQTTYSGTVSAEDRLGIYSSAYWLRLAEVLENDYPGVSALLGESEFQEMARNYIKRHDSPYYNVRWYGDQLSKYLSNTLPYAHHPYLAEMAFFEWSMTLSFDAEDTNIASMDDVLNIEPSEWPAMVFQTHPSLQRINLSWNIVNIWNCVDAGTEIEKPQKYDQAVPWLIWRNDLKIYFRSLDIDEVFSLDAVIEGASFGEICEGLCEWHEESKVALIAASMLKRWLADGLIKTISLI